MVSIGLALLSIASARERWITARTEHFEMFSCASESESREMLNKLEQFRATVLATYSLPRFRDPQFSRFVQDVVEWLSLSDLVGGGRFLIQHGELAGLGIALHPSIPIVVRPAAEFGDKCGPFLERELLDGQFDLLHRAHDRNDAERGGVGKRDFACWLNDSVEKTASLEIPSGPSADIRLWVGAIITRDWITTGRSPQPVEAAANGRPELLHQLHLDRRALEVRGGEQRLRPHRAEGRDLAVGNDFQPRVVGRLQGCSKVARAACPP